MFIGDSVVEDILAPKRMGMKTILCQRRPVDGCSDADAVADLSSVQELIKRFALGE